MKKPAAAKPKPRKTTPEHDIGESTLEGEAAVEVRVRLPKLTGGMASVNLDVGADTVSLSSPEYDLRVQLPHKVDVESISAKFSSKRAELKVLAKRLD
jgi:hypothetical protein